MNLHEYQSKELVAIYAIPTPKGLVADSPEAAVAAVQSLGGSLWVVKAQIHAGGRDKVGGVKVVKSSDEETAAVLIRDHVSKPVVAYSASVAAPPGKRMGHAGAIVAGGRCVAAAKFAALAAAGITTVHSPAEMGVAIGGRLK